MTPLPQASLASYWPWMRKGLETMLVKFDADWIPEDIYCAIKTGIASAFSIGEEEGFLVCRVDMKQRGPVLFVWVVYAPECLETQMGTVYAGLRALAEQHRCVAVTQEGRKGWGRKGWKLTSCNYELEP